MIRVVIPAHLKTLAGVDGEVALDVTKPVTISSVLDALEFKYPQLCGTVREHVTKKRRSLVRFYVCQEDYSHEPSETVLPDAIISGKEPFIILGSIAGG